MQDEKPKGVDTTTYHLPPTTSPSCVGMIMDGNRRWAKAKGLPSLEGHRRGYEKLKEVASWCREANISHLAVYAFSTENWKRTEEEVGYLMDLMRTTLREQVAELRKENTALHMVGKLDLLPDDLQGMVARVHADNPPDTPFHVWVALSYGGRAEIVAAAQALVREGAGEVSEESFASHLWSHGMPDLDIIIRTGGEHRLSNFFTWASVYSELFFTDTHWPDFSQEEFQAILSEFAARERRHGR